MIVGLAWQWYQLGTWGCLEEILPKSKVVVIAKERSLIGDPWQKWLVKTDPANAYAIIRACKPLGDNVAISSDDRDWLADIADLVGSKIVADFREPFWVDGFFFLSKPNGEPFVTVVISKSREYIYFEVWRT